MVDDCRRGALAAFLFLLFYPCFTTRAIAEKVYTPSGSAGSCVANPHGGNGSAAFHSGTLLQATQQCTSTHQLYNTFPTEELNRDIDLLISNTFSDSGYAYMDQPHIDPYLLSLDADTANEFHKLWRDFQLNFNYFASPDSTTYYGTFGTGNPNMLFNLPGLGVSDRNHVDIYLQHRHDGFQDQYPYQGQTEPKEDGDPASCSDDHNANSIVMNAGFKTIVESCAWVIVEDPSWSTSGERATVVTQHEFHHLCQASLTSTSGTTAGSGFPDEALSQAAEYLTGAGVRDAQRAITNLVYDTPLVNGGNVGGPWIPPNVDLYSNWYLWGIYLAQQFPGDTTRVEDDLIYKWNRNKNQSGLSEQNMAGLAQVLAGPEYASLGGSTGSQRLRNLYDNYVLAKWINNPSPSFYSGRLGFSRGIVPSQTPGFFDNSFAPFAKQSALEVPPRFVVDSNRAASDSTYAIGGPWQTTDTWSCGQRVSADTIGIWLYGSDYLQFDAADFFATNGKQNTLHFRMNWDASQYPGGGSLNSLRVAAISYSVKGDSLWTKGAYATGVQYAFVDSLHGFAEVWIPNYGTSTKSVVIAIDMGEVNPPGGGHNPRKLYYGYSFGVDSSSPLAAPTMDLTATRTGGTGVDYVSLQWSDPTGCGSAGYTIQRSPNSTTNFITYRSVPAGTYSLSDTLALYSLYFYRVVAGSCQSNSASSGGFLPSSQTLSGNIYLGGDVNTNGGITLSVQPGTLIRCATTDSRHTGYDTNKVEININGSKLVADGTPADSIRWTSASGSPNPGDWRGIELVGSGTAYSSLSYNSITYAVHGINLQSNGWKQVYVTHCAVRHSQFYGFWAFNQCSTVVANSIFEQNHGAEIGIDGNSKADVRHCFMRYSPALGAGAVDDGIVFTLGSTGYLRKSRISGTGMGLYCVNPMTGPLLKGNGAADSSKYGSNDILNFRNYGVRTYDEAVPELGTGNDANGQEAGRNNIFSTAYPTAIWVYHSSTTQQLPAKYCYWGASTPNPNRFVGNINGYTQSNTYLSTFDSPGGPSTNEYYPGYQGAGSVLAPEDAYDSALAKEASGDIAGAIADYKAIIAIYPDDAIASRAFIRLVGVLDFANGPASTSDYLTQVITTSSVPGIVRLARRLSPRMLLESGKTESALSAYEDLLKDASFDPAGVLFELALQKGLVLRDAAGARDAVVRLQAVSKDYYLLKHARAKLEEVVGPGVWPNLGEPKPGSQIEADLGLTLDQNTPNPMNPTAKIGFSLPRASFATLRVFDARGRLVKELVRGNVTGGRHSVEWGGETQSGGHAASGVYFYRLDALGLSLSKKLIVLE